MIVIRSNDAIWPRSDDFGGCQLPRLDLGEEIYLARAGIRDAQSAASIANTISMAGLSDCPPPESGVVLTEEDVEYSW